MLDGRGLIRTGNYLYQDDVGRDACGIGGVAARDGKPGHEVLRKAVVALKNMEHRGGVCGLAGDGAAAERYLYHARLELRERFRQAGLGAYPLTLSGRLVGYKGLLTSPQFAAFYPDLDDPAFETGLALFHRRYSTNTYPNWTLA